jgi:hypothetical protein
MNSSFLSLSPRAEGAENRAGEIGLSQADPSALQAITGGYSDPTGGIPFCPPLKPPPWERPYPTPLATLSS